MKPSEILEKHGWVQGALYANELGFPCEPSKACRFCAMGAMEKARRCTWIDVSRLKDHIGFSSIAAWNDAPGRTKDEVIAALKACGL